jgi:hypothetical protein
MVICNLWINIVKDKNRLLVLKNSARSSGVTMNARDRGKKMCDAPPSYMFLIFEGRIFGSFYTFSSIFFLLPLKYFLQSISDIFL